VACLLIARIVKPAEKTVASEWLCKTGSGGRGQFGNPEEGERPPLEDVTKQRSEDRD
jgi:hypothetical protein